MAKSNKFKKELVELINKHSIENGSDTPDFILAEYINGCLENFNTITLQREKWYGRKRVKSKTKLGARPTVNTK